MQMPDEILKQWSEVCDAATEGPWAHGSVEGGWNAIVEESRRNSVLYERKLNHDPNDDFVVLSRAALPRAIEALRFAVEILNLVGVTRDGRYIEHIARILNGETT